MLELVVSFKDEILFVDEACGNTAGDMTELKVKSHKSQKVIDCVNKIKGTEDIAFLKFEFKVK